MQQKPPYTYGGQTFRSLGAIEEHIKGFLDYYNRVLGREMFDPVLADVVFDRHYIWRHRGIRPTSFKFEANLVGDGRGWDDSLAGFFGPAWGWQRFSYHKALQKKEPTLETEFDRLCRERWRKVWRPRLFTGGSCVACTSPGVDVDHVSIKHAEIVRECWALVSPEDAQSWWHTMLTSDGNEHHFGLPEGHPVTRRYDDLTAAGTYRLLCKEHHRDATRGRPIQERKVGAPFEDPALNDLF